MVLRRPESPVLDTFLHPDGIRSILHLLLQGAQAQAHGRRPQDHRAADGKVVIIQEVEEPEYFHGRRLQISVFMSFFDVHVNWAPVSGTVSFYRYHRGSYLAAWHSKSSTKNERTTIVFKNEDGTEVLCRQIAGLFARRVVCYAEYDKKFKAGQQIGFIKFGSRADVFLPLGTKVNVSVGDKVRGAETVIAELGVPGTAAGSDMNINK